MIQMLLFVVFVMFGVTNGDVRTNNIIKYIGNAMTSSDDKLFQIVGNILTTYSNEPTYVKSKTNELSKIIVMNGYDVVQYVIESATVAFDSSFYLKTVPHKIQILMMKLNKKCRNSNHNTNANLCMQKIISKFIVNVVSKYSIDPELIKYIHIVISNLHKLDDKYQPVIENILDLFFQYVKQFLENPSFDNVAYEIVPKFMEKTIAILEHHNIDEFFVNLFEITDSPDFIVFSQTLLKDFELTIN